MGRKKKLVNNSVYPQHLIERFARCVIEDIRADFAREDVQADFARWMAERKDKNGAAEDGCSVRLCGFLFAWPSGLGFWTNRCSIGEIGLLISLEINK